MFFFCFFFNLERYYNKTSLSVINTEKITESEMDSPFHSFCTLIRSLDQNEDSIIFDRKLRYLASDINEVLEGDENILW